MKSIDRLIYDALAERRSVVLPGEGTLEVKRRGAKKISETQIIPPQNVVVFTPGEVQGARSVISLIEEEGGVSESEAVALYGSWLEGARRADGTIVIEGAGEVAEGGMIVAEGLHIALNPANEEIVTMETEKRSTPLWAWIVIAILAALLVCGAIWCCKQGMFKCGRSKTPVAETVMTANPASAESVAEGDGTVTGNSQAASPDTASAAAAASGTSAATATADPRFHVIAGAFSVESNADNFVAKLKREHPELTPEKIVNPQSGYHMVSILQAPTRREASNKMNLYWDVDLYLWIYEQK